ncbi:MAG: hypothetical protein EPN23_00620 [Verrucomicrobia bacterium]|nr:MAG: hypothetical protein EPN23_00620 [Verrucomicrobiota bacterium]
MNENTHPTSNCCGNPFLPIVLLALTLILVLGQNLLTVRDQKSALNQVVDQQKPAIEQSRQASARFTKMMQDLWQLAQTDAEAKAIVAKHGIAFTSAPATK